MKIHRRGLLLGAAAALALPSRSEAAPRTLVARPSKLQIAPEGYPETDIWGFEGQAPGPLLRARQGARLQRRLVNELPVPTSVHWHGIRIDNAMDGVAGLTQAPVAPGETFDYAFDLPDAGTFWYHAHTNSYEQVARGLYGALIVEEADAPEIDREDIFVLDDWRLDHETAQISGDFGAWHDLSHAGRMGNILTTNGKFDLKRAARRNERLRLRLINAANARILALSLVGLEGWIMALDGMPLEHPVAAQGALRLAPAQRMDLIVDVTAADEETAHLAQMDDNGKWWSQVAWDITGSASSQRRPAPMPLPPNPRQAVPGVKGVRTVTLAMEGGAMGRLQAATYGGKRLAFRDLAERGQFWAFNGTVGRTDAPLAEAALGETLRIRIVNDTVFPHAMHLHGMHFREVMKDSDSLGPLRDTLLVQRGETREIAFVADNPGDWLFHCHMLAHAAAGMTTWIKVARS
ncbi:multicopper oxidase family protein [Antarcticimicrobium luteum]|uniref:Multicopper oxidase family protein n=1 Tax=Antarcticimicrobium luteum TaxID=2547397 RepID=A0A4R5VGY6_9RHOB|nr:multicopper oxidase family protein [Antarcticimicrobium luteum]TDK52979.1 multicopper oxidase family protein [Antarcticimicrobium luteum]